MKLSEIAAKINGQLQGEDIEVSSLRSLTSAGETDLTILLDAKKYRKLAQQSKAAAMVVDSEDVGPSSVILVKNTRAIFVELVRLFASPPDCMVGISEKADIDPSAHIGDRVFIDAFVKVGAGARIGTGARIYSGVSIGAEAIVGQGSVLMSNVTVYPKCQIGNHCLLHSGAVIGADGFGFERTPDDVWEKVPQLGIVILEDSVEVGANSCIDRGAIQDTLVKEGTKIDNLVQIGHNCTIGRHNVISAACAFAGSSTIGNYGMWGGQCGTAGHMTVGNHVIAAGRSGVTKDVEDNSVIQGFPARPAKEVLKEQAFLRRWLKKQTKEEKDD